MQLKPTINVRKIGNEHILIANNGNHLDYTRVISLNDSAAYLLQQSENQSFTVESWADLLVEKYNINHEQALHDAMSLMNRLTQAGVIVP